MAETIALSRIEQVPADERIHHYDELSEPAKTHLPRLIDAEGSEVTASERVVAAFESYDLVKFTDYYRITVREGRSSASGFR